MTKESALVSGSDTDFLRRLAAMNGNGSKFWSVVQILQTAMLTLILAGGGYFFSHLSQESNENTRALSANAQRLIRIETQSEAREKLLDRVEERQREVLHRLDILEGQQKDRKP